MNPINEIATWVALSAAIPALTFTLLYGLRSPWYHSYLGVTMFALGLSITTVLLFNFIRRVFGEFPGFEWWALGIYSFLTLVLCGLVAILIVERRRAPMLTIPLNRKDRS